jgi:hypothetical protein
MTVLHAGSTAGQKHKYLIYKRFHYGEGAAQRCFGHTNRKADRFTRKAKCRRLTQPFGLSRACRCWLPAPGTRPAAKLQQLKSRRLPA